MPLTEPAAMQAALTALRGLDEDTERYVMMWLVHRLREERRGREASAYTGPTPTDWQFHYPEDEDGSYDTREEGIDECDATDWQIVEVTGRAAVHQEFLVAIPWIDDRELRSFPTRAAAEQCVREGKAHFAARAGEALNVDEPFDEVRDGAAEGE